MRALAEAGTVAVLLPGCGLHPARGTRHPSAGALPPAFGVPTAISTDCNPGSSPLASLLLAMNMACTLFRLTPGGGARRRHAGGGAGARARSDAGRIAPGLRADLAVMGRGAIPAELAYRIGFNPLAERTFSHAK